MEVGVDEADGLPERIRYAVHPVRASASPTAAAVMTSRERRAEARGTSSILPHGTLVTAARRAGRAEAAGAALRLAA